MEDLVAGLLCNPKGSQQQHLLFEGEIRATACWETNVACYDEVSVSGGGPYSGDQGQQGAGGQQSCVISVVFRFPAGYWPLKTSLEVNRRHHVVIWA